MYIYTLFNIIMNFTNWYCSQRRRKMQITRWQMQAKSPWLGVPRQWAMNALKMASLMKRKKNKDKSNTNTSKTNNNNDRKCVCTQSVFYVPYLLHVCVCVCKLAFENLLRRPLTYKCEHVSGSAHARKRAKLKWVDQQANVMCTE